MLIDQTKPLPTLTEASDDDLLGYYATAWCGGFVSAAVAASGDNSPEAVQHFNEHASQLIVGSMDDPLVRDATLQFVRALIAGTVNNHTRKDLPRE